jgi:hypothetical protein
MRVLCGVLALLLALFAAVQWNDPDALFWASIYGAGAAWCAVAASRPALLRRRAARALMAASLALALWALVVFWPPVPRWWAIDVWWPEQSGEAAREGMGMMVLLVALMAAAAVGLRRRA